MKYHALFIIFIYKCRLLQIIGGALRLEVKIRCLVQGHNIVLGEAQTTGIFQSEVKHSTTIPLSRSTLVNWLVLKLHTGKGLKVCYMKREWTIQAFQCQVAAV